MIEHKYKTKYPEDLENLFFYLMQHHIGVREQIMWICAQIALNTRVSLQHRGLLFALTASFASAPDIISQIMFTHYLHHPTRPGLLYEGFRLQHDDDNAFKKGKPRMFLSYHLVAVKE